MNNARSANVARRANDIRRMNDARSANIVRRTNNVILEQTMEKMKQLENELLRLDLPHFDPGDTVKVNVKISEGEKERIQAFQGVVISKSKGSVNASFTVRKVSYGIGVERIFPLHSPIISDIEVITKGRVRRAKIYYLRKLRGKAARIKERRFR
jgi:large subunit ribosomal protein L19